MGSLFKQDFKLEIMLICKMPWKLPQLELHKILSHFSLLKIIHGRLYWQLQ